MSWDEEFEADSALGQMARLFERKGVSYWMDQGTLLGLLRDGCPLPGDNDIDVSVWFHDIKDIRGALVQEFRRSGLQVGESYLYGLTLRKTKDSKPVNISYLFEDGSQVAKFFYPPEAGGMSSRLRDFLIYLCQRLDGTIEEVPPAGLLAKIYQMMPGYLLNWGAGLLTLTFYLLNYKCVGRSARQHFKGCGFLSYHALTLAIPKNPIVYIRHKYGSDWDQPRSDWVFLRDDGSLKTPRRKCTLRFLRLLLRRPPFVQSSWKVLEPARPS